MVDLGQKKVNTCSPFFMDATHYVFNTPPTIINFCDWFESITQLKNTLYPSLTDTSETNTRHLPV